MLRYNKHTWGTSLPGIQHGEMMANQLILYTRLLDLSTFLTRAHLYLVYILGGRPSLYLLFSMLKVVKAYPNFDFSSSFALPLVF